MRSCQETAALMSKASRSRLKPGEWLAVRLHLLLCRMCRYHEQQTALLSALSRKLLTNKQLFLPLSAAARQRIQQSIAAAIDKTQQ